MQPSLRQYLEELEKRYQAHYNIEVQKTIDGKQMDIFAISIIEHYRNILSKKIQIDHYQEREMILVKGFDALIQEKIVKDFSQFLVTVTNKLVTPSFDVMSHGINGIMVSSKGFSPEAVEAARKFKFSRTFCLGIKGWCDIRLLLIDIKNAGVFYNSKGKEIAPVYTFKQRNKGEVVK